MDRWMKVGLCAFLAVMLVSMERFAVAAPDVKQVKKQTGDVKKMKKQSSEMLKHAQEMVNHGKAAHPDVMTKHAKETMKYAQKTLDNIPPGNTHGEAAAGHIKSVIEQAKATIDDKRVDTAEQTVIHATEADKHIQQM